MGNEQFVWKPSSEGRNRGKLTVVLPSSLTGRVKEVMVRTPQGQVTTIPFGGIANQGRGHYRSNVPGSSFPSGSKAVAVLEDGQEMAWDIANTGSAYRTTSNPSPGSSSGGGTSGSSYLPTEMSAGGNSFMAPGFADWNSIAAPQVDFYGAMDYAKQLGQENKAAYYGNLTSEQSKNAALGLLQTDIQGMRQAADYLVPYVRQQGEQDLTTNISRAGRIDESNLSRIPRFNEFNQTQAEAANAFNQAQQTKAVESTGLGYKTRMTELLDQLRTQSTGKLIPGMDEALTIDARNRAAETSAALGISPISGAGIRAQDRLNILERMQLQQNAQGMIPGILQQAQNTMQAQVERVPTLYAQPTNVPLNASNIEGRLPIQSNISAGQAQMQIGTTATDIETIPIETALSQNLASQQFNATGQYSRDMAVTGQEQTYMNNLSGLANNALAVSQKQQALEGGTLDQVGQALSDVGGIISTGQQVGGLVDSLTGNSLSGIIRGVGSAITGEQTSQGGGSIFTPSLPNVSSQVATPLTSGYQGGGTYGTTGQVTLPSGKQVMMDSYGTPIGSAMPSGVSITSPTTSQGQQGGDWIDTVTNGLANIGNLVTGSGLTGTTSKVGNLNGTFGKIKMALPQSISTTSNEPNQQVSFGNMKVGTNDVSDFVNGVGNFYKGTESSDFSSSSISTQQTSGIKETDILGTMAKASQDSGVDLNVLGNTTQTISNWDSLPDSKRLVNAGNIGTSVLANKGIISQEEAGNLTRIQNAVGTITDPNASDAQKAIALSQATAGLATTQFTGNINAPRTINGGQVIGSSSKNGQEVFNVRTNDGVIVDVPKKSLVESSNMSAGLSALNILSSKASDEDKALALTSLGVDASKANDIISEVNAGNVSAGLQIFNLGSNWDEMDSFQKAISTMQTSHSVLNATSQMLPTNVASQSSLSFALPGAESALQTLGTVAGTAAAAYGIYKGVDSAVTTLEALDDMPESRAVTTGAKNLAMSGASIGGGVGMLVGGGWGSVIGALGGIGIGAATGAIAGATGTGKNAAQLQRDGWRKNLESLGVASKNKDGYHEVTLADGSKYNIGVESKNALTNIDGKTKRNTSDIDWDNKLAVNSIPMAHLFNIASGLNPNDNKKFDTFDRTVAQSVNAATSNAKSMQDVTANYKAMLGKAKINPVNLAFNVELLRAQNKIADSEYTAYMDSINQIYGTKILPTTREDFTQGVLSRLQSRGNKISKQEKQLMDSLLDQKQLAKNAKRLQSRMEA